MLTAVAVLLAVCGAVCFAFSAVHQHTAVGQQTEADQARVDEGAQARHGGRAMPMGVLGRLVRRPRWLLGMAFAVGGGLLALVALSIAPLVVIQPVGVLSVPFALLVHAAHRRRPPSRSEAAAALTTVAATGAFVWFVTGTAHSRPPEPGPLLVGTVLVGVLVVAFGLLGRFGPYRWHAVAWTAGGACLYGLGTSMIKSIFLLWQADGLSSLGQPVVWAASAVVVMTFPLGVWMIQHAYVAGAPQVVVAGLTVIDPLICVALGFTVLGEGGAHPAALVEMVASAAIAVGAVLVLGRSQALALPPPVSHLLDSRPDTRALTTMGTHR